MGKSEETIGESLGKVVCRSISETHKDRGKLLPILILINAFSNGSIPDPLRPSLPEDCALKPPPKTPINH